MVKKLNLELSEVKKNGLKFAIMIAVLKEVCNKNEFTEVTEQILSEWDLKRGVQQPLIKKAIEQGYIEVEYHKQRYIRLR